MDYLHYDDLSCCGIKEVYSHNIVQMKDKEEFLRCIRNGLKTRYGMAGEEPSPNFRTGSLLATAIDSQRAYKKKLKSLGFKRLARFRNHNTGRMVTMYLYTIKKEKGDRQ